MHSLLFGTPGIPISTPVPSTKNGIIKVAEIGLDAMELEFVRQVHVKQAETAEVKELATKHNVVLTCHGQYWINLASPEQKKVAQSIQRMLHAARIVNACGGWSITWHMAFYLGQLKERVQELVAGSLRQVVKQLRDENSNIFIRPETTGKPTQWGDLNECIKLSQEIEGVLPCIDFSHLHAREGKNNTTEEFRAILAKLEKELGRYCLDNMHIQISGINYGPKGEKNHLNLEESDLRWKELLAVWKEYKIKGVVITESPNVEGDALMLKKAWSSQ